MTFQECKESLFKKMLWWAFVPVFSIFLVNAFWRPGGLANNIFVLLPFLGLWLGYSYLVYGWVQDSQIKLHLDEEAVGITGSLEDGEARWSQIDKVQAVWQSCLCFHSQFLVIEAKECEIVFCLSVLSLADQARLKKAFAARGFDFID